MEPKTPPFPWSSSARLRWRQLWQVPTFLLGLTALIGTVLARPYLQQMWATGDRELEQARQILKKPDGNPKKVIELIERFLANPNHNPAREGEGWFLQGSARIQLAQRATDSNPDSLWKQAKEELGKAKKMGVPDRDRGVLDWRLGKVGFYLQEDPQKVVDTLKKAVPHAEDRVEAHQLLTQAWLRLPEPDLEEALKANEELRQLPLLGESVLAPSRLLGGELLLRLERSREAREVLSRIGDNAPKKVKLQAYVLRAESHQMEKQWTEAVQLWDDVLNEAPETFDLGRVHLFRGICQQQLKDSQEAEVSWRACMSLGNPEVAQAACVLLADLLYQGRSPKDALALLQNALAGTPTPDAWNNPYVTLDQLRGYVRRGIGFYLQLQSWPNAETMAGLYEKISEPGIGHYWQGQVKQKWAESLSENKDSPNWEKRLALFREGGRAYEQASELTADAKSTTEWLWLGSWCYHQGQSPAQVVSLLSRYLPREPRSDRTGEAYYRLGEAHRALNDDKAAELAWLKCIQFPGTYAYPARLQLARLEYARKQTGSAADILKHNIQQLRDLSEAQANQRPVAEAVEGSLYLLGTILFQRGEHNLARLYLSEALDEYPKSEWGQRGRFQLAEANHRMAYEMLKLTPPDGGQTERVDHVQKQFRTMLLEASRHYKQLRLTLPTDRGKIDPLSDLEEVYVGFMEARCLYDRGDYQASLERYNALAKLYSGRPEKLQALGESVRCYIGLQDEKGFRQRVGEVRKLLGTLDPEMRVGWEQWLEKAGKQFRILPATEGGSNGG